MYKSFSYFDPAFIKALASIGIPTDGLVLYLDAGNPISYPGTGTDWFDLSVNDNDADLQPGTVFDGVNAIDFDGVTGRVDIPHTQVARVGAAPAGHSVITWINNQNTSEEDIFTTNILQDGDILLMIFGNRIRGHIWGTSSVTVVDSPDPFGAGTWKMVSQVVNRTSDTLDIWENDIKVASTALAGSIGTSTRNTAYLGYRTGNQPSQFTGKISITLVYDRPLSDAEMENVYNLTKDNF